MLNAVFKIASKQYLGHLMTLEGEADRFIEESHEAILRLFGGWGVRTLYQR